MTPLLISVLVRVPVRIWGADDPQHEAAHNLHRVILSGIAAQCEELPPTWSNGKKPLARLDDASGTITIGEDSEA